MITFHDAVVQFILAGSRHEEVVQYLVTNGLRTHVAAKYLHWLGVHFPLR